METRRLRPEAIVAIFVVVVTCLFTPAHCVAMNQVNQNVMLQFLGNLTNLPPMWTPTNVTNGCDWPGIVCDQVGNVMEMGPLPESFRLNSTVPRALGDFPSLRVIDFHRTGIFGTIPPQIFQPELRTLYLNINSLTGTIPVEIMRSSYLENINLGWNDLNGTIPASLDSLPLQTASFQRNRFRCPFPWSLYDRINSQTNSTFCLFSGNHWDENKDDTICGRRLDPVPQRARCFAGANPTAYNHRRKSSRASFIRSTPKYQLEIHNNTVVYFARQRNGSIYQDEYVSFQLFSVNFHDVKKFPSGLEEAEYPLFETLPIHQLELAFENETFVELTANYSSSSRVRSVSLLIETSVSANDFGVKLSILVDGNGDMFQDREYPGGISLSMTLQVRGRIFDGPAAIQCDIPNPDFFFGYYSCATSRMNTSLAVRYGSTGPIFDWRYNTPSSEFSIDFPLVAESLGSEAPYTIAERMTVVVIGHSPVTNFLVESTAPRNLFIPVEDQGLASVFDLAFLGVTNRLLWDPQLSMLLLFDRDAVTAPGAPASQPAGSENLATVNLAAAISVPIVVVIVLAGILAVVAVPSLRRRFFKFETAMETRSNNSRSSSKASTSESTSSRANSASTSARSTSSSGRWLAAEVPKS